MLVSTKRNFGSHIFWRKAYSHIVPFCSICKASIVLGWSVLLLLSQARGSWWKMVVQFRLFSEASVWWKNILFWFFSFLFSKAKHTHQLVNRVLNQFGDRFSDYALESGKKKWNERKGCNRDWTGDISICSRMLYHWAMPPYMKFLFLASES